MALGDECQWTTVIWRWRGSDQDDAAIFAVLARDDPKADTSVHATAILLDALPLDNLFDASAKHFGVLYESPRPRGAGNASRLKVMRLQEMRRHGWIHSCLCQKLFQLGPMDTVFGER